MTLITRPLKRRFLSSLEEIDHGRLTVTTPEGDVHRFGHEGPEAGVYYRGTAQLKNGVATVKLPSYFEALTRKEGRTISLTNVDGFDRLAVKKVKGAKITIQKARRRKDYRLKKGHRQKYLRVKIEKIEA